MKRAETRAKALRGFMVLYSQRETKSGLTGRYKTTYIQED